MKKILSLFIPLLILISLLAPTSLAKDQATPIPSDTISVQGNHKIYICHFDGRSGNYQTLYIDHHAWENGHEGQHPNDYLGECQEPTVEPTIPPTVEPTIEPTVPPTIEPTVEPTNPPTIEPTLPPASPEPTEPTASPTTEPTTLVSVDVHCVGAYEGSLVASLTIENPTEINGTATVNGEEFGFTVNGNPTTFILANDTLIGTTYSGTITLGDETLEWSHDGCGEEEETPTSSPVTSPTITVPPTEVPTEEETPTQVTSTPVVETPVNETPTVGDTTPIVIVGTPLEQTPVQATPVTPNDTVTPVTVDVNQLPSTGQVGETSDDELQISIGDILLVLIIIAIGLLIIYIWEMIRKNRT